MDYRAYFNRHSEWPYIWSVDEGTQKSETKVRDVYTYKCSTDTGYDPTVKSGDNERPRVFINIRYATLVIRDGVAHFFHDPNWRFPKL
jgi:hypothetical protein